MDNQEAKFILRAFRASGADAADSAFSEALEQVRRDPSLSRWLEKEQAFDSAVTRKLNAAVVPAGLRESILAGGRVSHRPSRSWYRSPAIFALAACILFIVGLTLVWPNFRASSEREEMTSLAIDDMLHAKHGSSGEDSSRLRSYLENTPGHLANAVLPVGLHELQATGCRTLTLRGRDWAEVCFSHSGKEYHFYVTSRVGHGVSRPKIKDENGASAAAWSTGEGSYVLATTAGVEALKQLL